ncbi:anti-sigma factor family protein [Bacillus sp. PS06]|uniref:anti-sigma factor family protein n=1 Tax=Bacillus sp. PS06 TaxID=2764176 RepID=UPI00178713A9|nr:hypothetical protein [Bacillus sp. PS06]MBD8069634.1 hypothetical protein [Bacillus sp. PS06]
MNHYNQEIWSKYINNELEENQREQVENHLYSCDQCLELYMTLIEQSEHLPELMDDQLTEEVIKQLPFSEESKSVRKRRFTQHPLFHYGIAATITFGLMSSGVFQNITGFVSTVEAASNTSKETTMTESLMEKAINIINLFEPKQQKEGE